MEPQVAMILANNGHGTPEREASGHSDDMEWI